MVAGIIVIVVGLVFVVLGCLVWKKEMISLFHSYHYDKVTAEDKSSFCKLSGIGVLVMGCAMLVSGIVVAITDSAYSFIILAIGFAVGLAMMVMAGAKYNK